MWPFTRKNARPSIDCFAFPPYTLDHAPPEPQKLRFLSEEELTQLDRGVVFVGEQVSRAPPASFEGLEWSVVLGLVDGIIYKISAQWSGARAEAGRAHRAVVIRCFKDYGSSKNISGVELWDARNGNVILQSQNFGSEAILVVTLTSSKVSQFQPELNRPS
jgi:hypothetical protein